MKILLVLGMVLALAGCEQYESTGTVKSGNVSYKVVCIDSVEYVLRAVGRRGFMAPHFRVDGSLYLCQRKGVYE